MSKLVLCVCSNPNTGSSYLSDKHIIESIMGSNLNYKFLSGNDEGNSFPNMPDIIFDCVWFAGCNISSNLFSYNISEIIKRVQILANRLSHDGFVIFTETQEFKSNPPRLIRLQHPSIYKNITIEELKNLGSSFQDNVITPDEILCSNLFLYSLSKIWNYYFDKQEITVNKNLYITYKKNIKQRVYVDSLRNTILRSLSGGYRRKQTKKTISKLKY